jgi:hypothetical protein
MEGTAWAYPSGDSIARHFASLPAKARSLSPNLPPGMALAYGWIADFAIRSVALRLGSRANCFSRTRIVRRKWRWQARQVVGVERYQCIWFGRSRRSSRAA